MIIRTRVGNVDAMLNTNRIERNIREAQKLLNEQVVADSDPFVPFQQGALRGNVIYPDGIYGGLIEYNTLYAHYQYYGEVYGPNIPIRDSEGNIVGWYSPPSKQPTGKDLTYHTPGTSDHWFEKAKAEHKDEWVRLVKQTMGRR